MWDLSRGLYRQSRGLYRSRPKQANDESTGYTTYPVDSTAYTIKTLKYSFK